MRSSKKHTSDEIALRIDRAVERRKADGTLSDAEKSENWLGDDRYERNLEYYLGHQYDWREDGRQMVIHNALKPNVDILVSSMSAAPSRIRAYPRMQDAIEQAEYVPRVLQYEYDRLAVNDEVEKARVDLRIFGWAAIVVGWEFEEVNADQRIANLEAKYGLAPGRFEFRETPDGHEIWHVSTDPFSGLSVESRITDADAEVRSVTVKDDVVVKHIPALNIFFDPIESDIRKLKESRYIVWREYLTPEQVKRDKRNDKDAHLPVSKDVSPYVERDINQEEMVEVWYYLGENPENPDERLLSVRVGDGYDIILREAEWPYDFEYPFAIISNRPDPGRVYPMSDIDHCIHDQDEINNSLTDLITHRRRWDRILFANADVFDEDTLERYKYAVDGEIIPLRPGSQSDMSRLFYTIPTAQLQQEAYITGSQAENRIRMKLGVTEYQQGIFPDTKRLATEVVQLSSEAATRARDAAEADRKFRTTIVQLMLDNLIANADPERRRQYSFLGEYGQQVWDAYSIEDIRGDFDCDVQVVDTSQGEIAKLMQMVSILTQFTAAGVNPQTGQLMFPDADGSPIIKNVKPIVEQLVLAMGWDRLSELTQPPPAAAMMPPQMPEMPVEEPLGDDMGQLSAMLGGQLG